MTITDTLEVYDNGGETIDRYTAIIGHDVYGMSKRPSSPQGVNQFSCGTNQLVADRSELGREITDFSELPDTVVQAIDKRCANY